jgi:sugar phosphate isomerase/epimerase
MKLGMPQLYEFSSIEDNLILASELSLNFVELNLNFSETRREMEKGNLSSLFEKYGLFATLHFYDEGDLARDDEVGTAYLSLLSKYAALGRGYVKCLNVHLLNGPVVTISGNKNYIYKKDFSHFSEKLVENLKKADEICGQNGMMLVIENTDYLAAYHKRTYEILSSNGFKFNYDIGHDRIGGDFLLSEIIPSLNLKFHELHVHDALGDKCHLAIGEGDTDFSLYSRFMNDALVLLELKSSEDLYSSIPRFKRFIDGAVL